MHGVISDEVYAEVWWNNLKTIKKNTTPSPKRKVNRQAETTSASIFLRSKYLFVKHVKWMRVGFINTFDGIKNKA